MKEWLNKNWPWVLVDLGIALLGAWVLIKFGLPLAGSRLGGPPPRPVDLEALRASGPATVEAWETALTNSITAAGDYLVAYQLSNGELPYQMHITAGSETGTVSYIRMIAGAGSLYTVCRVAEDDKYCRAGDMALVRYLAQVVEQDNMPGACFYSRGQCWLGGNGIAIDAIYKRWQATASTEMDDTDLLDTALRLGENIAWLRKEDGSLIHAFDPHLGTPDEAYYDPFFSGESLMALLELYEMTNDPHWLEQARQTNAHMLQQEVGQDHWHAYAFRLFARLDDLSAADIRYANEIGQAVLEGQEALTSDTVSISAASKVEALVALAVAFEKPGEPHEWLVPGLETFSLFVMAHQLPAHQCEWSERVDLAPFEGGIYASCERPFIRVDGNQHWINGAATYLEYLHKTR